MSALLVDLGGTHLRCGLSHDLETAHVLHRARIRSFLDGQNPADIWEDIIRTIAEFTDKVRDTLLPDSPIVFSFPGPVTAAGRIADAPTVSGRSATFPDVRQALSDRTGRPVHMLNDISAAAWHVSRRIKAKRFMVVTVSSGIGSKIFDRDHARGVIDDVLYAGEIGHITVDESLHAPECDCGGKGHLGAIASGRAIERQAKRYARWFGATPKTLMNEIHVVPAAKRGHSLALRIIREATAPLARVLLQNVVAAGLEKVVIIGGFALGLGETYLTILREEVAKRCDYKVMSDQLHDLFILGDDDACLLGAAAYAAVHYKGVQC